MIVRRSGGESFIRPWLGGGVPASTALVIKMKP